MGTTRGSDGRLRRDVVESLDLFLEGESTGSFGSIQTSGLGTAAEFTPPVFEWRSVKIQPVDVLLAQGATLVVFRVSHQERRSRIRLDWFRESDPTRSPVVIVDEDNGEFLYPFATSLTGDVLPGRPRTGILAFRRFRRPTSRFTIHFLGVRIGRGRAGSATFAFRYGDRAFSDGPPTGPEPEASDVRPE